MGNSYGNLTRKNYISSIFIDRVIGSAGGHKNNIFKVWKMNMQLHAIGNLCAHFYKCLPKPTDKTVLIFLTKDITPLIPSIIRNTPKCRIKIGFLRDCPDTDLSKSEQKYFRLLD